MNNRFLIVSKCFLFLQLFLLIGQLTFHSAWAHCSRFEHSVESPTLKSNLNWLAAKTAGCLTLTGVVAYGIYQSAKYAIDATDAGDALSCQGVNGCNWAGSYDTADDFDMGRSAQCDHFVSISHDCDVVNQVCNGIVDTCQSYLIQRAGGYTGVAVAMIADVTLFIKGIYLARKTDLARRLYSYNKNQFDDNRNRILEMNQDSNSRARRNDSSFKTTSFHSPRNFPIFSDQIISAYRLTVKNNPNINILDFYYNIQIEGLEKEELCSDGQIPNEIAFAQWLNAKPKITEQSFQSIQDLPEFLGKPYPEKYLEHKAFFDLMTEDAENIRLKELDYNLAYDTLERSQGKVATLQKLLNEKQTVENQAHEVFKSAKTKYNSAFIELQTLGTTPALITSKKGIVELNLAHLNIKKSEYEKAFQEKANLNSQLTLLMGHADTDLELFKKAQENRLKAYTDFTEKTQSLSAEAVAVKKDEFRAKLLKMAYFGSNL